MKNIFKTVKGKKFFSAVLICFVVGGLTMSVFYLSNGKSFDDRSMASDRQLPAEYEKADLNGDKKVSMEDFGIWVKLFRSYKNDHTTFDSKGDLNGDKKISMEDFREWLLLWRGYKGVEPVILPELLVSLSFNGNITNKVTEVKFVSKDSTGNKAPTFVQGKEGEAVFFDGNKDSKYRISYDDEDPLLFAVTSFTIMAYVKKDEGTCNYGRCTIFSKGNSDWQGYSLYLNNARKLTLRLNDKNEGEVSSVEALEDNKWYHVASTYNGTTREIKLYIDGVLSATSVYGEDINYGNASAMIGNGNSNLDLPFRGAIDEVRFFTTPLSEKEIRTYLLP